MKTQKIINQINQDCDDAANETTMEFEIVTDPVEKAVLVAEMDRLMAEQPAEDWSMLGQPITKTK